MGGLRAIVFDSKLRICRRFQWAGKVQYSPGKDDLIFADVLDEDIDLWPPRMPGMQIERSEEHLQAISNAIDEIVMEIINTEDTGQLCFAYLRDSEMNSPALTRACEKYLENINKGIGTKK